MALKPNLKTASFENTDDVESDTAVAAAAPAASVPAVAAPAARHLALVKPAAVNMADWDILAQLEGRLPPVDFGEGVRLVGSNGQLMDGDKRILGDNVVLTLLSWNKRWVVSPGDQGQEAREYARYSLDGQFTTKGEPIQEYVAHLKSELGYGKAAVKEYADLFGVLEATGKPCDHVGSAVTISLSPDSVKSFSGFRRDLVVKGMTGRMEQIDVNHGLKIKVATEIKSAAGNTWTRLVVSIA